MAGMAMANARARWWVIGSAAVALQGGEKDRVEDIDILLAEPDAEPLFARLGLQNIAGDGHEQFRSHFYGHWTRPPVRVEFMAGLEVRHGDHWGRVFIESRKEIRVRDMPLYVPGRREIQALLHMFGRDKDIRRAASLDRK
ncbi:hypothetical protein [Sphingomicrobium nitratireducens]|uniref:hypothetical protein n=1 Tax=Sphingomicrobium nitratireducens TaxID=2964666 RepID=UPI0022401519|nr:hypothetical protein [Sphingomicrobium nitratireducens]